MLRTVLSIVLICLVVFSVCCGVKQPDNSNLAINVSPSDAVPSSPDPSERKSVDYFAHIKPEHREVLRGWLKSKPYLRPAVEEIDNSVSLINTSRISTRIIGFSARRSATAIISTIR